MSSSDWKRAAAEEIANRASCRFPAPDYDLWMDHQDMVAYFSEIIARHAEPLERELALLKRSAKTFAREAGYSGDDGGTLGGTDARPRT